MVKLCYYFILAPMCPKGMVYQQCGSMCPQTCEYNDTAAAVCAQGCAEGCFCPDGKVLDDDGHCTDLLNCSSKHNFYINDLKFVMQNFIPCIGTIECPKGMVYNQCGPVCTVTCTSSCSDRHKNICKKGCFCPNGTILNEHNGQCVYPDDCTYMSKFIKSHYIYIYMHILHIQINIYNIYI